MPSKRLRRTGRAQQPLWGTALAGALFGGLCGVDEDLAAGRPITIRVVVALCDNVHQGS